MVLIMVACGMSHAEAQLVASSWWLQCSRLGSPLFRGPRKLIKTFQPFLSIIVFTSAMN